MTDADTPRVPDGKPSVESTWLPLRGETEPQTVTQEFETLAAAWHSALSLACCAGTLRLRVTDEHGVTRFTWDREDNVFRTIREERKPTADEIDRCHEATEYGHTCRVCQAPPIAHGQVVVEHQPEEADRG